MLVRKSANIEVRAEFTGCLVLGRTSWLSDGLFVVICGMR